MMGFIGCNTDTTPDIPEDLMITHSDTVQINNLARLCKVWGFVKYTHQAFLTGELCWDDELLSLISDIISAHGADVNDILLEWFLSLGDDGYDRSFDMRVSPELIHILSDTDWINRDYLGEDLAAALSSFIGSDLVGGSFAPVYFETGGIVTRFTNQDPHLGMDYGDYRYRLLGLFRLWNVIEYYFPHKDILDVEWQSLLTYFIPHMLEGTDRLSYEKTLAALASHLQDANVSLWNIEDGMPIVANIMNELYGIYVPPALFVEIGGELMVAGVLEDDNGEGPLMTGDVVLRANGIAIGEAMRDKLQYVSYPRDEVALNLLLRGYLFFTPLRQTCSNTPMEIDILRDGEEVNLTVDELVYFGLLHDIMERQFEGPMVQHSSHKILDNNIGVIHHRMLSLSDENMFLVMRYLADTDGLIIDMRQNLGFRQSNILEIERWLFNQRVPYRSNMYPSRHIPGAFIGSGPYYIGNELEEFNYEKDVIILMNHNTIGFSEFVIMALRNGDNVTVMGSNSLGGAPWPSVVSLPGGINMSFTGIGIFGSEGEQIQRVGLSPDIYVHRTKEGIIEFRDELMDAAIAFLIEQ